MFKSNLYVVEFKVEGYEQTDNGPDDDLGKGGEENPKKGEPPEDDEKKGPRNDTDPELEGSKKSYENGNTSATNLNKKGVALGTKSVKRALNFEEDALSQQVATLECVSLLKAMELEDGDEMDEDREDTVESLCKEDEELSQLSEEWVFFIYKSFLRRV